MSRRTVVGLSVAAALAVGCSNPSAQSDGGARRALDLASPVSVGLAYQKTAELEVRYRTDDAARTPIAGAQVRFGIFGDPAGSTLSRDLAVTDGDGVAQVQLTAGAAEASFSVSATADNAPAATFHISVSKQPFVEIDAAVSSATPVVQFEVVLYDDRGCALLPPSANAPAGGFSLTAAAQAPSGGSTRWSGLVAFTNLLSVNYAVVGRGLSLDGRLVAASCVDVPSPLVPPGSASRLELPLVPVVASPAGGYQLMTVLSVKAPAVTDAWHRLTGCPLAPAQSLLDAMESGLAPSLAAAVAAARGAADSSGCRPATAGAGASLDADLEPLLTAAGSPGAKLAAVVGDLDAIVSAGHLTSHLTLAPAADDRITGEHLLSSLALSDAGGASMDYDVGAAGLPIVDARDIAIVTDPTYVTIGPHGFTLGLPLFWQRALSDLALAPRGISPPSSRGLVGAVVGAASHGGKTGCAAVEDLICASTGAAGCAGNVEPACSSALDAMAAALDAGFVAPHGIDLTLQGRALAVDSTGDLLVDRLDSGQWTPAGVASATFTGMRDP